MIFNSPIHLQHDRVQIIDLVRGIDIIPMVIFNYSVTLDYFGLYHIQRGFLYKFFPLAIASIFIFLSGIAAFASFRADDENFSGKYFRRGTKLFIFAAFISLFTRIFVPEGTIYFGILHFFAVSSFILPFFIKYDKLKIFAIPVILSGIYLQTKEFDFPYLLWLGFMPGNFFTFDYFPLMPWFGLLLLGVFSGKYVIESTKHLRYRGKHADAFIFLGRNSLMIYLVHQPLLIFLLFVSGYIVIR